MLWLDAHPDFNTPETTRSGSLGGMPVAVATGRALQRMRLDAHLDPPLSDAQVVMAGVRLTDPLEQNLQALFKGFGHWISNDSLYRRRWPVDRGTQSDDLGSCSGRTGARVWALKELASWQVGTAKMGCDRKQRQRGSI